LKPCLDAVATTPRVIEGRGFLTRAVKE
jgi:hypothetical protein